jgi:hypothetical protein
MGELAAQVAILVIAAEFTRYMLGRFAGKPVLPSAGRPGRFLIRGFALLTFPLVLLIYLMAVLSLLPYVLLSKPYRLHLREVRRCKRGEWHSLNPFSGQLASFDVTDFLTLPFKPVFDFMDRLEHRPARSSQAEARPLMPMPHKPLRG